MHVGVTRAMHVGVTQRSCRRFEHGWRGGFHARCPRVSTRGFLDRGSRPQEAPGGSRGTPGRTRARVPCMWALPVPCMWALLSGHAGVSSMDGGVVFIPGVPGFPPGASWTAGHTHKKPPAEAGEAPVRIGGAAREPGRLETIQASIGKPAPLGRPTVTVPAARPTSRLHAPEGQP